MPILTTSSDVATGDVFDFTTHAEVLTVASNVLLSADSGAGVFSTQTDDSLVNYGAISATNAGVAFEGGGPVATILNQTGASILGSDGILNSDVEATIINNGTIVGYSDSGIFDDSGESSIYNNGYVYGLADGITVDAADEHVYNKGTITGTSGGSIGLSMSTGTTGESTYASNTGLIQGVGSSVGSSGAGALTLTNQGGTLQGNVDLANRGGDAIRNTGAIHGNVKLGNGTNTFDGRGGTVDGLIQGGKAVDTIRAGSDGETMSGGAGHDNLYAGAGADVFVYSSASAANADHIFNFNVAHDLIELSGFTALAVGKTPVFAIAAHATSASDHLFYNSSTGALFYDADGSGSTKTPVEIANLGPGLKLTAHDFEVVE